MHSHNRLRRDGTERERAESAMDEETLGTFCAEDFVLFIPFTLLSVHDCFNYKIENSYSQYNLQRNAGKPRSRLSLKQCQYSLLCSCVSKGARADCLRDFCACLAEIWPTFVSVRPFNQSNDDKCPTKRCTFPRQLYHTALRVLHFALGSTGLHDFLYKLYINSSPV